jgi:hypothetical protein
MVFYLLCFFGALERFINRQTLERQSLKMGVAEMHKKAGLMRSIPLIILVIIAGLAALNYTRYIDLSGFMQDFGNANPKYSGAASSECPATSCGTGACCSAREYDPDLGTYVGTYAVLTYERCECPSDTEPTPIAMDTQTPGGPYKVCKCKGAV